MLFFIVFFIIIVNKKKEWKNQLINHINSLFVLSPFFWSFRFLSLISFFFLSKLPFPVFLSFSSSIQCFFLSLQRTSRRTEDLQVTLIIPPCLRSILRLNDRVSRREKALGRSPLQMCLRCRVSNSSEVIAWKTSAVIAGA